MSRLRQAFLIAALLAPATTHASSPGPDAPNLVAVYVNETREAPGQRGRHEVVAGWLEELGDPKWSGVAERVRRDRTAFPAALAEDRADIIAIVARVPGAPPVLLFTNGLTARGVAELFEPGSPDPIELPFALAPQEGRVAQEQPLGTRAGLEAALGLIRRQADARAARRVRLFLKSHGSNSVALTARVGLDPSALGRVEFRHRLREVERGERDRIDTGAPQVTIAEMVAAIDRSNGRPYGPIGTVVLEACGDHGPAAQAAAPETFVFISLGGLVASYRNLDWRTKLLGRPIDPIGGPQRHARATEQIAAGHPELPDKYRRFVLRVLSVVLFGTGLLMKIVVHEQHDRADRPRR